MPKESIALVDERSSGQSAEEGMTQTLKLSTPSFADIGINVAFKHSTQSIFVFECPGCKRYIDLDFISIDEPRNFVLTGQTLTDPNLKNSYLKCHRCDKKLDFESKQEFLKPKAYGGTAHFQEQFKGRDRKGFIVNQLYSMAKAGKPYEFAQAVLLGEQDPTRKRELFNSKLGKVYEDEGVQITDSALLEGIGPHKLRELDLTKIRTMGVDVGSVFNIVVYEWKPLKIFGKLSVNDKWEPRLVYAGKSQGKIDDFKDTLDLFQELKCSAVVIDAEPERRLSQLFVQSAPTAAFTCDYLFSQQSRSARIDEDEYCIKVNRTAWLDLALSRFKNQKRWLPKDLPKDFNEQIKAPKRIRRVDKWGQPYGLHINEKPDHYAHACLYAEVALPVALGGGSIQRIMDLY